MPASSLTFEAVHSVRTEEDSFDFLDDLWHFWLVGSMHMQVTAAHG